MKFKVGDIVKAVNIKHDCKKHFFGREFIIKKAFTGVGGNYIYDVGETYLFNEPELELVKPKFKVGDKVKIIAADHGQDKNLIGDIYTVDIVYENDCSYMLNDRCIYIWAEEELELVKEKFDHKNYPGKYAMHCKTQKDSNVLLKYLHDAGLSWRSGDSLLKLDYFYMYTNKSAYDFDGAVGFGFIDNYIDSNYKILNFEDFDWSDFIMEKKFTKADLKNGDVIKRRNGDVEIVCVDTGTLICSQKGFNSLSNINDDLTYGSCAGSNSIHDIIAVLRPKDPSDCRFDAFNYYSDGTSCGELVYERKEIEEMTLEEVCKALGKEIKIVKN